MIKKLSELTGTEILNRTLMTWDYQVILQEGAVIKKDYIEKLEEMGITEVSVRKPETTHEIVILKTEVESMAKQKVKEILGRHTYQHNDELSKLAKTADNIITTILEDDEVIEKVYDIKQRSSDLYEHSISVCSMATLTALKMNLDKQNIRDLGVGCLLHDMGLRYVTVAYEDRKMESFSEKELTEYKKHPIYGFSAIKEEKWISDISKNIILHHHERKDGSGYPLKTRDLSIECKIVAVCEAFDEMICGIANERSKVYEAVEFLKNASGTLLDKTAVETFLKFTAVYPAGTHVVTNEGEIATVVRQNPDFQDRPVLRIIKDREGNKVKGDVYKDMVKITNIFIEKVLE
ncbi:MAG: HD domain-containing protein [Lachnospiraceae bacterium]|jgi:HD-GYP domain-containing protein (c-di-GMP phosphodiesterase class II)|nr:HD domain-containing protein [Lachnospiraceae bacterium]